MCEPNDVKQICCEMVPPHNIFSFPWTTFSYSGLCSSCSTQYPCDGGLWCGHGRGKGGKGIRKKGHTEPLLGGLRREWHTATEGGWRRRRRRHGEQPQLGRGAPGHLCTAGGRILWWKANQKIQHLCECRHRLPLSSRAQIWISTISVSKVLNLPSDEVLSETQVEICVTVVFVELRNCWNAEERKSGLWRWWWPRNDSKMSFGLISPAFLCDTALAGLRARDCVRVSVRFVCTSGHVHRCTAHHTRACQVEGGVGGIPVEERTNKPGTVCGACNAAAFEAMGRSFF